MISRVVIDNCHHIAGIFVGLTEMQLICNVKIIKYMLQISAFVETTENMHTGGELYIMAFESLQTTSDGGIFLQNSDFVTLFRKKCACHKSAKSASDDDAGFHFINN